MVEFEFALKDLFPERVIRLTSNLLPNEYCGEPRDAITLIKKYSHIIDHLGGLSSRAQNLTRPITSAQRLKNAQNQCIYIMADTKCARKGYVLGFLKVGTKNLYLYDESSQTRLVKNAPCILDFYIHESRQRSGLGKQIFDYMLNYEQWTPIKCTVDRPSEKMMSFLKKHYGLSHVIPQSNNFVAFKGYFDPSGTKSNAKGQNEGSQGDDTRSDLCKRHEQRKIQSKNSQPLVRHCSLQLPQKMNSQSQQQLLQQRSLQIKKQYPNYQDHREKFQSKNETRIQNSPIQQFSVPNLSLPNLKQNVKYGRYSAHRPQSSMAEIMSFTSTNLRR